MTVIHHLIFFLLLNISVQSKSVILKHTSPNSKQTPTTSCPRNMRWEPNLDKGPYFMKA